MEMYSQIYQAAHTSQSALLSYLTTPRYDVATTVPFAMKQVMKEEVIKMDKIGITKPSTSDYASPSVVVTKKDGSQRC